MKFLTSLCCLVLAAAFCVTTNGALLGMKRCTWGPSYWCSNIKTSHECSAFQHCKQTVWLNQQATSLQDQSTLCQKCDELMDGINQLVRDNATTADALEFVRRQCTNLMPSTQAAEECARFLGDHLKEVMALLRAGVPDRTICTVVGLCVADGSVQADQAAAVAAGPQPTPQMCGHCKNFMRDIVTLYTDSEVEDILTERFSMACQYCPVPDRCRNSIRAYIHQAMSQIREGWDPEFICENINFCPGVNQTMTAFLTKLFDGARSSLSDRPATIVGLPLNRMITDMNLLTVQASLETKVRMNANNPECMLCEWVMTDMKKELKDNRTEEAMVQAFEHACRMFPERYQSQCVDFVHQYADTIMEMLRENVDVQVCDQLNICTQPKLLSMVSMMPSMLLGDEQCDQCKQFAQQMIVQLRDPQTQQSIKNLLNSFCRYAPKKYEIECEGAINQFVPQFLSELSQMLTPAEVCQALHMCDQ